MKRFSPKQMEVLRWWRQDGYDAVICDGAVRSGKTYAMTLSFFLWAMTRFRGKRFGLCAPTKEGVRRNVLAPVRALLEALGVQWEERTSRGELSVRYGGRENHFYLFGGRNEASAALIQGVTLAGVLLDEVALMPRSFVEQACARCSEAGSKLWFSCNPAGPEHWFYREWVLGAEEKRAQYIHFTMADNPALSDRVRQRYERMFQGTFTSGLCWASGWRPRDWYTISSTRRSCLQFQMAPLPSGVFLATTGRATPPPLGCGDRRTEYGTESGSSTTTPGRRGGR